MAMEAAEFVEDPGPRRRPKTHGRWWYRGKLILTSCLTFFVGVGLMLGVGIVLGILWGVFAQGFRWGQW